MQWVLVLLALAAWAECTPLHHHHHRHGYLVARATTSELNSGIATLTAKAESLTQGSASRTTLEPTVTENLLPKMTTHMLDVMPTLSTPTTSYSYSITVPPSGNDDGYQRNPFVRSSSAPRDVVFIAIGAVIGAILLGLIVARIAVACVSRRRARIEKEVYQHNFSHNLSSGSLSLNTYVYGNSTQLSLLEKSTNSSNYKLHKQGSANTLNWDTSTQGRTYRNMLTAMLSRNSMTVGPVLELMIGSRSNADLPLFHDPGLLVMELPVIDDLCTGLTERTRRERPPSQLLDDLLNLEEEEKCKS